MKWSNEVKVGALITVTAILAVALAWIIGIDNPFSRSTHIFVTYNFAGGIEIGSPVRVSGIKVGKVEQIDFFSPPEGGEAAVAKQQPGSADTFPQNTLSEKAIVPVRLRLAVRKDAIRGVRADSQFYINLAGVIGERYIEITPGSLSAEPAKNGQVFAGVDPPRIDQLISQSFNLAGKIIEIIEENKGDLSRSLELLYKLSGNLNKTLAWVDKSAIFKTDLSKLIDNLIVITTDVRQLTQKTRTPEGEKTLKLLHELLWRLEPLDGGTIRQFLQKEGIRARIF